MTARPPATFAEIEDLYSGSVFPNQRLFDGCATALCLFSAEWFGRQDVYWIAKAGLVGTCVDLNAPKLSRMRDLYPDGWEFVAGDVYDFAAGALEDDRQWDVLTLDPWTGQFERCAQLIDTWTALARRVVVLGHGDYRLTPPEPPDGWRLADRIIRSDFKGGVYWLVFQKC